MKQLKKALVFLLCALCALLPCALGASAADGGKTVSVLCYNVAGLPSIDDLLGKPDAQHLTTNQTLLGRQLNESAYDVIAVQEDFNYHRYLADGLTSYPNKTHHTGGVPGGDGLNVFARVPVYNETRTAWEQLYGVIDDGADEMTPKGVLYTVLDFGDGILIDLYDIHADAYGDAGSCAARRDNFRQLAEMIQQRGADRPVIVTGDFNASIHQGNDDGLYELLYAGCGLKDAWVELHNDGNYENFDYWEETVGGGWPDYWGVWDSLEKFLYRDGGGIHVEANTFAYTDFLDDQGRSISDHKAAEATFTFTKTDAFAESDEALSVTPAPKTRDFILKKLFVILVDLIKALMHFDEAKAYLGIK